MIRRVAAVAFLALVAFARFSSLSHHWQVVAAEQGDDDGDDGGDDEGNES